MATQSTMAMPTPVIVALSAMTLRIARPVTGILAVTAAICAPLAIVFQNEAFAAVQQHFGEPASIYPANYIAALFLCAAIILCLAWMFLRTLTAIITSAKNADPLTTQNADRLARMGWIMLVIQLFKYPTAWLGLIVETAFKGPTSTVAVSGTAIGLTTVLTLFMLSSIFRDGAALRTCSGVLIRKEQSHA